jgi:Mg2+-importing ATPase
VTTRSATASREGDPFSGDSRPPEIPVAEAAGLAAEHVLERLGSAAAGLTTEEAGRRLSLVGPNAVRTHRAQPLRILVLQLRSPVLILLAVTATISFFLGQRTDTVVIGVILVASIGLGFVNEYRAERATDALHSQVTHRTVVMRAGRPVEVDVTTLVPGDVVRLGLGEVVPADCGC